MCPPSGSRDGRPASPCGPAAMPSCERAARGAGTLSRRPRSSLPASVPALSSERRRPQDAPRRGVSGQKGEPAFLDNPPTPLVNGRVPGP
jgi:hypothetical protein